MARNRQIGALWERTSKAGNKFLSGVINNGVFGECSIAIFKQNDKRSENSPDYFMIASEPLAPTIRSEDASVVNDDDDDLPFN